MASMPEVTVSIEASLHRALREVLQSVATDYGVMVTAVNVEWNVVQMVSEAGGSGRIKHLKIVSESL